MNRHQRRRHAGTTDDPHVSPDLCPRCNALKVFCHALDQDIRTADGNMICYPLDEDGKIAVVDFGIMQLMQELPQLAEGEDPPPIVVQVNGEEIYNTDQNAFEADRPWLYLLAAIRKQLDATYGPANLHEAVTHH